jgi:hypothetical protein
MQTVTLQSKTLKTSHVVEVWKVQALANTGGYRENIFVAWIHVTESSNIGYALSPNRRNDGSFPGFNFAVTDTGKLEFV